MSYFLDFTFTPLSPVTFTNTILHQEDVARSDLTTKVYTTKSLVIYLLKKTLLTSDLLKTVMVCCPTVTV